MPLYRYVKAVPQHKKRTPGLFSYGLIGVGFFLIVWTVWPIVSFFLYEQVNLSQTISPVPLVYAADPASVNPNAWFPTKPQKKIVTPVNSYYLSIPSLDIDKATVIISGDDLTQSLIHYGGTGIPGEYGGTVIFGHSTLPQFFKGAKDYKSIFSTLPTIKIGDLIILQYDKITYTYKVYDKVVVEPTDLSVLEQHFDDSYLTVVTCVPPGTLLYRLNVKARLVRI